MRHATKAFALMCVLKSLASAAGYKVPNGTVLYYPFDTAATALESFGPAKARLEQGEGGVAYSGAGRTGGCLYFGGSDTLELRSLPAAMPLGKAPYTVSAWIRADKGLKPQGGWLGYGERNTNGAGNSFRHAGPDAVHNYWNWRDLTVKTPGLGDGAWHQVVGTWDGETRKVYFDGKLAGEDRQAPDIKPGPLLIGRTINDVPYKGWIDEVLVVARPLDPAEIARATPADRSLRIVDGAKHVLEDSSRAYELKSVRR